MKKLQNSFTQTTLGSIIWLAVLTTIFNFPEMSLLQIIALGLLAGLVFGIAYPLLWQTTALKNRSKISLSALLNMITGSFAVYTVSPQMFDWLKPALPIILLLTLLLHSLGVYAYQIVEHRQFNQNKLN